MFDYTNKEDNARSSIVELFGIENRFLLPDLIAP